MYSLWLKRDFPTIKAISMYKIISVQVIIKNLMILFLKESTQTPIIQIAESLTRWKQLRYSKQNKVNQYSRQTI
jgi:hypothetical protein